MNAIETNGLSRRYGSFEALREVSVSVAQGTIVGLLGPNGAGKTTLIKALVGALRPTSGSVKVLGLDPLRDRAALRSKIGYMPQAPALYGDLSARENLRFFGSAHGVAQLEQRIDEALKFTELTERADGAVHTFSGGMQKRVSLACTLLHRPALLILDEPTAAVDPSLKVRSWAAFRQLAAEGVTILVSTHLMDEALLCDRVAVLQRGRLIASDTPTGLLQRGRSTLTVNAADEITTQSISSTPVALAEALHGYGLNPGVSSIALTADNLETIILRMIEEEH